MFFFKQKHDYVHLLRANKLTIKSRLNKDILNNFDATLIIYEKHY